MGKNSRAESVALEENKMSPRFTYLETALDADLLDERYLLENTTPIRKLFYQWLPVPVSQIIETLFIHKKYDIILSQYEKVGFQLAFVFKLLRQKSNHLLVISRITSPDPRKSKIKMWYLRKVKDSVSRFLIWSSNQRKLAIDKLGVEPKKIVLIKRGTDQDFWIPQPAETDMICSAGMEARDYPTLVQALGSLSIPCHIAVSDARGEIFDTVKKLYDIKKLPAGITIGKKNYVELRDLYARSRFVVISLLPSDSDNGLTTILEAMAMGKPVICSKTEGQVDVIQDGVTGIFVPQGDPLALKNAIEELWNDPQRCEKMGRAARKYIELNHNLEQFSESIIGVAHQVMHEKNVQHKAPRVMQT